MRRIAVSDVAVEAASALTYAELAGGALRTIGRALEAPTALLYEVPQPDEMQAYVVDGPSDIFARYAPFAASDPLRVVKERHKPRLAVTTNLVEKSRFRRAPVYGEVYEPLGVEHHLVLRLSDANYGEPGVGAVVFCRHRDQAPWTREDGTQLAKLAPLLSSALTRARRFATIERRADALSELVVAGRAERAFGAWDLDGRAVWLSPAAEREPGLADLRRDDAPQVLSSRWRQLKAAIERGPCVAFDTRIDLATCAGPVRADLWFCATPRRGMPFLAMLTTDRDLDEKVARAGELFGLSPGERRVLLALADGRSNAELSRDLFVSVDTVRTHVQRILRKMRCDSRLKAVTRMMDL